jgi:hypothetical protein
LATLENDIRAQLDYASDCVRKIAEKQDLSDLLADKADQHYNIAFQRIIANRFMLLLLCRTLSQHDQPQVMGWLEQFRSIIGNVNSSRPNRLSYNMMIIFQAARVVFSDNENERRDARSEFKTLYGQAAANYLMPYDILRFAFLADRVRTSRR